MNAMGFLGHAVPVVGAFLVEAYLFMFVLCRAARRYRIPGFTVIVPLFAFTLGALPMLVVSELVLQPILGWWSLALGFPGGIIGVGLCSAILSHLDSLSMHKLERL